MQKIVEEFIGGKAESTLEKGGQHHNFVGIRCWGCLPLSSTAIEAPLGWGENDPQLV
jgi:hypothetical protein